MPVYSLSRHHVIILDNAYSGFLEVTVIGPNGTLLTKQSGLFRPVLTGSVSPSNSLSPLPAFASMSDSTSAIIFGTISGLTLVLLLLLFVLCFLKKKASENIESGADDGNFANGIGEISRIGDKFIVQPVLVENLPMVMDSGGYFQTEFETPTECPDCPECPDCTCTSTDLHESADKIPYRDIHL